MYEQERDRLAHLTILLTYTIFVGILAGEATLLHWDMGAVVLLLLGVVACWIMHITGRIQPEIRMWMYFILTMLAFFYYGSHETSMYDMAPVIIFAMQMYSMMKKKSLIYCCVATYYIIMFYDFIFVCERDMDYTVLGITRLLLHLVLVGLSGYMITLVIRRHNADQKESEERIAELEEINHRTEQFLTNVSHELRTPINAVTGITTVMVKNEKDSAKRKDILAVQHAGRRLFQQIEDILDYTEIDTGRMKVSEESYMIASVVNDIIAEENQRETNDLEIVFDVDASVPSALIGDGRKVKKIIKHLLDNGLKFTKNGGVYVRITAMNRSYGVNLCIQVRDTGMGVNEEQLEKIKERFFQTKNGKMRRAGGLGLGLAIVCGMVAVMEGFIQIKSKEGEGTEVFISLPQKIADEVSCMSVSNVQEYCVACYLKPEKYEIPEVRGYFNSTITHIVRGLELPLHRISNKGELDKLISIYRLTHLFIGQEEYSEDKEYYEELTTQMNVIVVAQKDYALSRDSKLKLIKKPLCSLAIANALNSCEVEVGEIEVEKHILCPGVRVLVVDDEPMNLMVAEGIFREYQMEVTTVDSGMAAIELCKKETYDLIFLDHMMPEMDGVETLKLLRKISTTPGKALTVIAFTANAVSGAREMFRQEGFDGFISKPVEAIELERVLKRVLPRTAYVYEDEDVFDGKEKSGQKTNEEYLSRLERSGVNTRSGLQYCRGDVEFYLELLDKFTQEFDKKNEDLKRFFEAEDCANYRICVHSLKSTSKMVGADDFSAMAREAEEAAKREDMEYIKEQQNELLAAYECLVHNIKEMLGSKRTNAKEIYTEITKEEFLQKLQELKRSLETFEIDKAELLISQLNETNYNQTPVVKLLTEIKQDVENFECNDASVKLETLFVKVEGGEV